MYYVGRGFEFSALAARGCLLRCPRRRLLVHRSNACIYTYVWLPAPLPSAPAAGLRRVTAPWRTSICVCTHVQARSAARWCALCVRGVAGHSLGQHALGICCACGVLQHAGGHAGRVVCSIERVVCCIERLLCCCRVMQLLCNASPACARSCQRLRTRAPTHTQGCSTGGQCGAKLGYLPLFGVYHKRRALVVRGFLSAFDFCAPNPEHQKPCP